jgi:hypothetical protein
MTIRNIYVWGCSDDLIEITGDIENEFGSFEDDPFVVFSDGTVLKVIYDNDGNWRFYCDELGKDASVINHPPGSERAIDISNGRDYTAVAEVQGHIDWVVVTNRIVRAK